MQDLLPTLAQLPRPMLLMAINAMVRPGEDIAGAMLLVLQISHTSTHEDACSCHLLPQRGLHGINCRGAMLSFDASHWPCRPDGEYALPCAAHAEAEEVPGSLGGRHGRRCKGALLTLTGSGTQRARDHFQVMHATAFVSRSFSHAWCAA